MKTDKKINYSLKSNTYYNLLVLALSLVIIGSVGTQSPAFAEHDHSVVRSNESEASSAWDDDEGFPRRFIQWPRVTIGLVWSDPTSGQMKVMDLGSAPEDGQFTPDVLMSRCMRAAGRFSSEGRVNDAFSGATTRTLHPLSDAEIEALLHGHSSRK